MRIFVAALFICLSSSVFSQGLECLKFRDGKFQITDATVGNAIIERTGSRQIEYGERSNLKLSFDVKWLDDCTYTLTLHEILENPDNIALSEGLVLTIEILETTENSYFQRTTSNLYDLVVTSELVRIE